ncbi:MAG: hypothetical protein LBL73_07580, partial [Synergistaceae bacterium]|nr:hypothetical protein [Synergistaceae bacterium]
MKRLLMFCMLLLVTIFARESTAAHRPFKAAVLQFNPILNERDKNIEALAGVFEEAMKNGARLIVAPEMSTTGYHYANRRAIAPFVDTLPGKATDVFSKLTAKYGAYVVFGLPEADRATGLYYNAAALVGPKGFIGAYRKTHQWETEEHWSSYGDLGVPVFDTELGRIAINICMDSAYFESARLAALGGADVLAFPTNSTSQAIAALPARAIQNGLFIVSANRSNTENNFHMIGGSAIWAPDGSCLAQTPLLMTDEESETGPTTVAYATIDPARYSNAGKELLKARRPALYKDLMLHIAPWNYVKSANPRELKGYVAQFRPKENDAAYNAAKIRSLLAETSGPSDIIVLPENALYGTEFTKQSADTGFFAELARERGSYLVGTFVESEGDNHYITAVLYDRKGNAAGRYRKTHLNGREKLWASPGDDIPVFTTDIGRIGIIIGDEVRYPEIAGLLAVGRADMIAIPSSWTIWDGGEWQLPQKMSANPYPRRSMVLWDAV